jgi:hypothetical protein
MDFDHSAEPDLHSFVPVPHSQTHLGVHPDNAVDRAQRHALLPLQPASNVGITQSLRSKIHSHSGISPWNTDEDHETCGSLHSTSIV